MGPTSGFWIVWDFIERTTLNTVKWLNIFLLLMSKQRMLLKLYEENNNYWKHCRCTSSKIFILFPKYPAYHYWNLCSPVTRVKEEIFTPEPSIFTGSKMRKRKTTTWSASYSVYKIVVSIHKIGLGELMWSRETRGRQYFSNLLAPISWERVARWKPCKKGIRIICLPDTVRIKSIKLMGMQNQWKFRWERQSEGYLEETYSGVVTEGGERVITAGNSIRGLQNMTHLHVVHK